MGLALPTQRLAPTWPKLRLAGQAVTLGLIVAAMSLATFATLRGALTSPAISAADLQAQVLEFRPCPQSETLAAATNLLLAAMPTVDLFSTDVAQEGDEELVMTRYSEAGQPRAIIWRLDPGGHSVSSPTPLGQRILNRLQAECH